MVRIGFVVEGDSEQILIESDNFTNWAKGHNIEICKPVINARGAGNLCPQNIDRHIQRCLALNPNKVVVLTDLECEPCVTKVKERIGNGRVEKVFVAKKAIEAWFLADTEAMRHLLKNPDYSGEERPEETSKMPWDRLKEIAKESHKQRRGLGESKISFVKKMIKSNFSIERAALHPQCQSAQYFVKQLIQIADQFRK